MSSFPASHPCKKNTNFFQVNKAELAEREAKCLFTLEFMAFTWCKLLVFIAMNLLQFQLRMRAP